MTSQTSPTRSQGPIIPTQQALEFILPVPQREQSSQNSNQQTRSNHSEQSNPGKRPKEEEKDQENNENKMETNRGKKKRQKKNSGSSYDEEVEKLKEELRMIDAGTHPELIEQLELFDKRTKRQIDLEEIEDEFEEAEIKRISGEMQKKEKEASAEAERRVTEIVQQIINELDREMKKVDTQISALDIARPLDMPCDGSKKILRAPLLPIKKATDTGKALQPPIPLSSKINSFLLKDAEIADDLKSIGTDGKSSPMKASSLIDVTLSKLKFSYGGRWYKPGEEVLVENREYGKIPAKIDTINDEVVLFKSCYSWDVRQIFASYSDFAEGRVIIHNKKRNA